MDCYLFLLVFVIVFAEFDCQQGPKVAPFTYHVNPVIGGSTSFLCQKLSGSSPLKISWFKDGEEIQYSSGIKIVSIQDSSFLIIEPITSSHSGNYTCKISNKYGYHSYTAELLIEPPPAPLNFTVQQVWSRTVSVSWVKPPESEFSIIGYTIRYWKVSSLGVNDRLHEMNVSTPSNLHLIKDLEPGSNYESTVSAVNEVGYGAPSQKISFVTGEEEPSGAPIDLQVIARGPTTARLAWRSPPRNTWNGKLLGFYVGYRFVDDYKTPYCFKTVSVAESNSSHHEYFLRNLMKGTAYSIILKAFNSAGNGPESSDITVKIVPGDVPSAPRFHVSSFNTVSITLCYFLSSGASETIEVHYKEENTVDWLEMGILLGNKDFGEYTLTALNSDAYYTIYLTASNKNGMSDPSNFIKVQTAHSHRDSGISSFFDGSNGQYGDFRVFVGFLIIFFVLIIIIVILFATVFVRRARLTASTKPKFDVSKTNRLNETNPIFDTERQLIASGVKKPLINSIIISDQFNRYPMIKREYPLQDDNHSLIYVNIPQ